MNENEISRIAASINSLRPDWPTASLRTLITDKLGNRPRRDVAVALTWVACESDSKTPARVLEAGPWWRATSPDASLAPRPPKPGEACQTCGRAMHTPDAICDEPTRRPTPKPADIAAPVAHLRALRNEAADDLCSHGVKRANCLEHLRADEEAPA